MCDPEPRRGPSPTRNVSLALALLAGTTVCLILWTGISVAVWAADRPGQDHRDADAPSRSLVQGPEADDGQDQAPPAALLTEEGAALAERLRHLRRSESRMGPRHPALPEVRSQIEQIRQQLQAWESPPNPFRVDPASDSPQDAPLRETPPSPFDADNILQMSDQELRQLVRGLVAEVRELRQRLDEIENRPGPRGR